MKRYIKPSIDTTIVELQQIMAGSNPGIDPTDSTTPEGSDAKGFNYFGSDYDADVDPTPQTFNVWED
jgi:hypothetical protein